MDERVRHAGPPLPRRWRLPTFHSSGRSPDNRFLLLPSSFCSSYQAIENSKLLILAQTRSPLFFSSLTLLLFYCTKCQG